MKGASLKKVVVAVTALLALGLLEGCHSSDDQYKEQAPPPGANARPDKPDMNKSKRMPGAAKPAS